MINSQLHSYHYLSILGHVASISRRGARRRLRLRLELHCPPILPPYHENCCLSFSSTTPPPLDGRHDNAQHPPLRLISFQLRVLANSRPASAIHDFWLAFRRLMLAQSWRGIGILMGFRWMRLRLGILACRRFLRRFPAFLSRLRRHDAARAQADRSRAAKEAGCCQR